MHINHKHSSLACICILNLRLCKTTCTGYNNNNNDDDDCLLL